MRTNRLTSRIAAHGLRQQAQAISQAEDLQALSDRIIANGWRQIISIVKQYHGAQAFVHSDRAAFAVRAAFDRMNAELQKAFASRLSAVAVTVYDQTAAAMSQHIPIPALVLQEDDRPTEPGVVKLGVTPAGTLGTVNLAAPLANKNLSKDAKRDLAKRLIFDPPDAARVRELVYRGDWFRRLEANTKLAAPEDVAKVIRIGFTQGKSMRDIQRDLLPVLGGVQSSARRVAHNETMRIANEMKWDAWQEVDDLIAGYQVHAVDDGHNPTSRPEHRARHLTVYYKLPKPGQKGLDEMPSPPYESPKDGRVLAHFCRCWLTPVFKNLNAPKLDIPVAPLSAPMPQSVKQQQNELAVHPIDPSIASEWFSKARVRDRKAAVGNERYNLVRRELDREPTWLDFVDPLTGVLLSLEVLQGRLASAAVLFAKSFFSR